MKRRDVRWFGPSLNNKKKRVYRPGGSRLSFQVAAMSLLLSRMKLSPALLNSKLSKGTWREKMSYTFALTSLSIEGFPFSLLVGMFQL